MTFGYLFDEHVSTALYRGLKRRSWDLSVWRIGEPGSPVRGTPDPELLTWCEANRCVLITNNRATIPVHLADHLAAGRHVPGIFMLDPDLSVGDTIQQLIVAALASYEDEYRDQIRYLPLF